MCIRRGRKINYSLCFICACPYYNRYFREMIEVRVLSKSPLPTLQQSSSCSRWSHVTPIQPHLMLLFSASIMCEPARGKGFPPIAHGWKMFFAKKISDLRPPPLDKYVGTPVTSGVISIDVLYVIACQAANILGANKSRPRASCACENVMCPC